MASLSSHMCTQPQANAPVSTVVYLSCTVWIEKVTEHTLDRDLNGSGNNPSMDTFVVSLFSCVCLTVCGQPGVCATTFLNQVCVFKG